MTEPRVAVGIPHLGNLPGYFFDSMSSMHFPGGAHGFIRVENKPVDTARNAIAKTFLENERFTHLMWFDADMTFHPETVARLLAHDLPIVSGLYLARTDTPIPHMYNFNRVDPKDGMTWYDSLAGDYAEWLKCTPEHKERPNAWCFDPDPAALIKVDAVGFGCVLMAREVIEKMEYPYFEADPETGGAEDFDFCEKAKRAGFQVFCDMTVQANHCIREGFIGREEFVDCWHVGTKYEADFSKPIPIEVRGSGTRRIRPSRRNTIATQSVA